MTSGGRLVSGSGDNTIKIWDLNTAECRLTLEGHSLAGIKFILVFPEFLLLLFDLLFFVLIMYIEN